MQTILLTLQNASLIAMTYFGIATVVFAQPSTDSTVKRDELIALLEFVAAQEGHKGQWLDPMDVSDHTTDKTVSSNAEKPKENYDKELR